MEEEGLQQQISSVSSASCFGVGENYLGDTFLSSGECWLLDVWYDAGCP